MLQHLNVAVTWSFSKHTQALQAYEAQVSSLVRGMSQTEKDLQNAQEENAALLSDLASVRELCVKLDSGKELTARQLTSKSMDLERVRLWSGLLFSIPFFFLCAQNLLCLSQCVALVVCLFIVLLPVLRSLESWKMFAQR